VQNTATVGNENDNVGGSSPGVDVMIVKIFSPKNLAKTFASFAQTVYILLVFSKKLSEH
jgi:hypothetical protein